ncbi:MAG TPA: ATP-binding protein [Eubacteriales bacterium]|nr:ATP-binding protein [Eubacteriales bacterium]
MELTIISGKGGTGKTTVAVALSDLIQNAVKADCDVDAPNLYLYYKGEDVEREPFSASKQAVVDETLCVDCGACESVCRFGAIAGHKIDPFACEGCGACALVCPQCAITLDDQNDAQIVLTQTQKGMLSRAEMAVGSEGSGKLVTLLRKNARRVRKAEEWIVADGSPGVGCPVIASITGADLVLIVTEPTLSGLEDFKRVAELCGHFNVQAAVCVNKFDINPEITETIQTYCAERGIPVAGKIPFDEAVPRSINELKPITAYKNSAAHEAVLELWGRLQEIARTVTGDT